MKVPAPFTKRAIDRLVATYRSAIREDNQMCLCGLFGPEIDILPEAVGGKVKDFYRANIVWAAHALCGRDMNTRAEMLVAGLVGALLTARSQSDPAQFDRVARLPVRSVA